MKPLRPPDSLHLQAARGWLELENHVEAGKELEEITPRARAHPEVVLVRWAFHTYAGNSRAALDTASELVRLRPHDLVARLGLSISLHELKRTKEALDNLLAVEDKFSDSALLYFDLARYECQLGRLDDARARLRLLFEVDRRLFKELALSEPDLEPLWKEIRLRGKGRK